MGRVERFFLILTLGGLTGCGRVLERSGTPHLAGNAPAKRAVGGARARAAVPPARELLPIERRLVKHIESERGRMTALLKELVEIPSGSGNRAGLRKVAERLADELKALGFEIEWVENPRYEIPGWPARLAGDHLVARRGGPVGPHIVLLGHMDTIFEDPSVFSGFRVRGQTATGPGALDMKGGIVVMLHALRALADEGLLDALRITVVLDADEETGSLTSRPLIERVARDADAALVFEGSVEGNLTLSRGGLGQYRLRVTGRAAHVADMQDGVDAVYEMAAKILHLKKLTRLDRGITVNVAPVRGGTKRNQVADWAECEVDVRYGTLEAGRRLDRAIRQIARRAYIRSPTGKTARTEIWGVLHRPPMRRTPESMALAEYFRAAARDLKTPCGIVHSRGGSDANLTAHLGIPTIDGLGPVGAGAHTTGEHVDLSSLTRRCALTAIGLSRLLAAPGRGVAASGRTNPFRTESGER